MLEQETRNFTEKLEQRNYTIADLREALKQQSGKVDEQTLAAKEREFT